MCENMCVSVDVCVLCASGFVRKLYYKDTVYDTTSQYTQVKMSANLFGGHDLISLILLSSSSQKTHIFQATRKAYLAMCQGTSLFKLTHYIHLLR